MQPAAHMPYEDREQTTFRWVALFVLISLLVHAILFLVILLITLVVPPPKLEIPPPPPPEVSLSLQPVPVPPPPQRIFMPTAPQPNAPQRDTLVESDNNTQLASHSKTDRANSIMPDVVAKTDHSSQLENSPNSPTKQQQPAPPTPPTAKQEQPKPPQPTPPQPKPTPPQPAKPPEPQPPKPQPPKVAKNQVDPITGLPVLPPINAPTLEPQSTRPKSAAPPRSIQSIAADISGRAGMSGPPNPDATETELGKYKAKVYAMVASRWYPKVEDAITLLPVGLVKIQYTIHDNGTIDSFKVLEGDNSNLEQLKDISQLSMVEAAPFDPFTDGMRKELAKAGKDTDSYTDYFYFSVYGQ